MADVRLKLSPPWVTYVNMVNAMFGYDPDVEIDYNNDGPTLIVTVKNSDKAAAVSKLIPQFKKFGNIVLEIILSTPNGISNMAFKDNNALFTTAFTRNPIFAFCYSVTDIFANPITYVVFKNRVAQFFNDNLNDIYGNLSTLHQNIAEEIFADANLYGVYYCTDVEENTGKPLGEWP